MKLPTAANEIVALATRLAPPPRLFFETKSGVEEPPPGRGRRYWIVARSLCRMFRVPLLPAASRARQLDALALEVKRLSAFENPGSHFHITADFAIVWLWDQDLTRRAAAAIGADIAGLRIVPEPAMQPPDTDGVRLVEMLDGVEAQYWAEGALAASRWWPEPPGPHAWLMFQRGAGLPPDRLMTTVPPAVRLPWLQRPWTTTRRPGAFDLGRADARVVVGSLTAAMLLAYGYQGAQLLRVDHDVAALADEIATRSQAIEPLLQARGQALEDQSAIRVLHDLDRYPSQLALMARVAEVLPPDGGKLTAWIYDRGQLELGITASRPVDVVKLVRSLEGLDHFKSVAAERTGTDNSLRLHVTLDPL